METALIVSGTDAGVKALFALLGDLRLRDVRPALYGLPGRGHIKQRQLFGHKKGTGACVRLLRRFPLRFP